MPTLPGSLGFISAPKCSQITLWALTEPHKSNPIRLILFHQIVLIMRLEETILIFKIFEKRGCFFSNQSPQVWLVFITEKEESPPSRHIERGGYLAFGRLLTLWVEQVRRRLVEALNQYQHVLIFGLVTLAHQNVISK